MDFKITEAQKGLYLDHLTQVYNRVFLFEKIKPQINEKHPFTLFMIDFDNFKNINDSFGHLAGDKTLVLVSQGIKNIIPKDAVLIRYAGDEFIVVLETPDIDRVKSIAEDILNSIRVLDIDFNNTKINQTLSIGISFYPGESNDLNQLIGNADAALYLSKKRGKNNYAFYNEISIEQMSLKIGLNYFPCSKIINHENIIEELKDMSETNVFGGMLLTGSSGIGKSRIINAVKEHVKKETLFDINPLQKDCLMPFSSLRNGISAYIKKLLALEDVDISLLSDLSNENKKILDFFINPENNFNLLLNNCTTDLINSALLSFFDCIVNKYSKLSIIIDNFQFIDLKSLNFLKMLMESSYSRNVKFYATVLSPLPENINNPEALTKTITEISNIPKIISHEIHPLTKENTREMIDFIFPGLGDNLNFSADIFEISNGQPFFIEELLKLLLVKNFIFHEDGGWNIRDNYQDKIPKTLTEVIRQRLITLDPEIKETILISSLLGETISPELISRINSSNENDVLEILSKANKQKILREDNNTFSFFNPAAKDTALNELSADKKDELFSLASDALLDSYTDNLEEISFQLANIFKNNNDLTRLNSLSQIISKNASNILNSEEILAYLEDISFKRKKAAHTIKIKELSLEDRDLILGFLRHFQAAVNYSGLYPSNNKLRIQIVEDIFKLLELLLSKYSSIEISEVDKNLVVNQIRLTDYYTKGLDLSSITTSFIERNIKTVTFYNGINLEELRNFISVICLNPDEISKIGEWQAIISKNKLTNISINQAVYISEEKSRFAPIKNKIEGAIISDFLLGKLSGKDKSIVPNLDKDTLEILKTVGNKNTLEMLKNISNIPDLSSLAEAPVEPDKSNKQEKPSINTLIKKLEDKHTHLMSLEEVNDYIDNINDIQTSISSLDDAALFLDFLIKSRNKIEEVISPEKKGTKNKDVHKQNSMEITSIIDIFVSETPKNKIEFLKKLSPSEKTTVKIVNTLKNEDIENIVSQLTSTDESLLSKKKLRDVILTSTDKQLLEKIKKRTGEILEKTYANDKNSNISKTISIFDDTSEWDKMPLVTKIDDLSMFSREDFEVIPADTINKLLSDILKLSKSDDFNMLKKITSILSEKQSIVSDKLKNEINRAYMNFFINIEKNGSSYHEIVPVFCAIVSLLEDKDMAFFQITFLSSLLKNMLSIFKIDNFDKNIYEKILIINYIFEYISLPKKNLTAGELQKIKKDFALANYAEKLFNLYITKPRITEFINTELPKTYLFFSDSPLVIAKVLNEKISSITDPFENFSFIQKISRFILSLNKEALSVIFKKLLTEKNKKKVYDMFLLLPADIQEYIVNDIKNDKEYISIINDFIK